MGEYLVYSLQNITSFETLLWLFFVYPQILDPGAVQRALLMVYVVVNEVEVEMEVVVIQ